MIGFRRAPPAPKLYKLYAKGSRGSEHLKRIQEEAQALINRAVRKDAKHLSWKDRQNNFFF
jgi:hypothetical protein